MPMRNMILTLCGSLRAQSWNARLLGVATRLAPPGLALQPYPGTAALPWFNPDLEASPPAAVHELKRAVSAARGLIIASPEYAHGVPGALKNALDWLVSGVEIVDKPALVLSVASSGEVAHGQLVHTLRTMAVKAIAGPRFQLAHVRVGFDEAVTPALRAALAELAATLASPTGVK